MTKHEELAAFNAFVESLPQNTYLRPWLTSILPEIERELRCDIFPEHTPASWAAEVRKQAQEESQRLTNAAHREAAVILDNARMKEDEVAKARQRLYLELGRIQKELY